MLIVDPPEPSTDTPTPPMTQYDLLQRAKQGNSQAIADLLNVALRPRGVSARANLQGNRLHVLLESAQEMTPQAFVPAIRRAIENLNSDTIQSLAIYARRPGEQRPLWAEEIDLGTSSSPTLAPMPGPTSADPQSSAPLVPTPVPAAPVASTPATPASRDRALARNILIGALIALFAGVLGLNNWVMGRQQQALDEAQTLAAGATSARNATDIPTLRTSQQKLREAIALLESIPEVPGSGYQRVEEELTAIRWQLSQVEERLRREEQAAASLKYAQQLGSEADKIIQQAPRSLETRRQAEAKLQEAVSILAGIPEGTFVSGQARSSTAQYLTKYSSASRQVATQQQQLQQQYPITSPVLGGAGVGQAAGAAPGQAGGVGQAASAGQTTPRALK